MQRLKSLFIKSKQPKTSPQPLRQPQPLDATHLKRVSGGATTVPEPLPRVS